MSKLLLAKSLPTLLPLCLVSAVHASCIPSGTEAGINSALTSAGSVAVLCPEAVFTLQNPVTFTAVNQKIYTEGLPTDATRAILRVTGAQQSTAIQSFGVNGAGFDGIQIKNIEVDGDRPALGRLANGNALIEIGGVSTGNLVQQIFVHDPRGWSALHIFEGSVTNNTPACQGARILNNQVGPSGTPNQQWADGISLSCGNSTVENNVITDATDGGIVVFGAPGSLVKNNTIHAVHQVLLGGINMVDFAPLNGNYTNTRVIGNTIDAAGAFIKTGIAMGPQIWGCGTGVNSGATVMNNTLTGAHFGYGFPVNGVSNWKVSGNVDHARHIGVAGEGCDGNQTTQPAAFQDQVSTQTVLQSQYVPSQVDYVLAVAEPPILSIIQAPSACGILTTDQGLIPGQSQTSCDGRFVLSLMASGDLVLMEGTQLLYHTRTAGLIVAQAIMQADGNFVLYDVTGEPVWDSGTQGNDGAYFDVGNDGNLVIYLNAQTSLWNSGTCCH